MCSKYDGVVVYWALAELARALKAAFLENWVWILERDVKRSSEARKSVTGSLKNHHAF
jgi:hypothetical protein